MKKQKRGEIKIRHRQRDTTSVVSSVNSNVTRALTVRKPAKPQLKRRRTTAPPNEPSESASHDQPGTSSVRIDQPGTSSVPTPPVPQHQEQPESSLVSDTQSQNEGRKQKRPQFYGFTEADISPTSSLTSSNPSNSKKDKTKKQSKKSSATEESVVALIQSAEKSRVPSPPRPDIKIGQVSPPDFRI